MLVVVFFVGLEPFLDKNDATGILCSTVIDTTVCIYCTICIRHTYVFKKRNRRANMQQNVSVVALKLKFEINSMPMH